MKFLLFTNLKPCQVFQGEKYLKLILNQETERFLNKHQLNEKPKLKQLMRNITELIEQDEV
jgi:hypothetical protein